MKKYKEHEWDLNHFKSLSKFANDPSKKLVHNRMGRLYWVWDGDRLYEQRFARENGPYQGRNLKFLRRCYPNARTAIDIGMNVANNTIEYGTFAQTVHGFEPFPSTYALAVENIELGKNVELKGRYWDAKAIKTHREPNKPDGWWKENGQFASLNVTADIRTYNIGLGDVKGSFEMEEHPNNAGHNCILTNDRKDKTKYSKTTVAVETLDSYNFTEVDFIKIDCEGYELPILKGAVNTVRTNRPVVQIEIVEAQCKKFNYTAQDIFDYFKQFPDYVCCDFTGADIGMNWQKLKGVMDRFFVPKEVFDRLGEAEKIVHPGMRSKVKKKNKPRIETTYG